jgi:predicted Zn-dependent protease
MTARASDRVAAGAVDRLQASAVAALRVVAADGDAAHLEVTRERVNVLRFGQNRIVYQHAEERPVVRVHLIRGRREGWATLGSTGATALRAAAGRLAQALAVLPDGDPTALPGPRESTPELRGAATSSESTLRAGDRERAAAFEAIRASLPGDLELGGSIVTAVTETAIANTSGLAVAQQRTRAAIQLIVSGPDGSTFVRRMGLDWSALDPLEAARTAIADLPRGRLGSLETVPTRALLGPQAVATLAATLAYIGLGALPPGGTPGPFVDETAGTLSPQVGMTDDGLDPAGLPARFDAAGWAKRRVRLIDGGRVTGVVHDARTAALAGVEPTGHTAPPSWRFGSGPSPSHLLVDAGPIDIGDLLRAVDRGLVVQRVDYVRVLQPRQGIVTGTTRNATLAVRDGIVAGPVPQFRFTVSLPELFAGVEAVGTGRERGETAFIDSVTAPAMVVASLPIDALARR